MKTIESILDLARWAPSGDNTQPWAFEIIDDRCVAIHGRDTREHCVYDLDGHPSQISLGALLETAAIAASSHGLAMHATRRHDASDEKPVFDLVFEPDAGVEVDALVNFIKSRSVQRRPLGSQPLSNAQRRSLEISVGRDFRVHWLEGFGKKLETASLMFNSAKLRLTMREAYLVHRDVIQWRSRYSAHRVPDQALGVDGLTTRLMQFVMVSWDRVEFFNRYFAGTWIPRLQMDFLPSLACAGHFVLVADRRPTGIDDYVAAGRALQRFWLTASQLDLLMQPEVTPLIFARYAREAVSFSATAGMAERANRIAGQLARVVGDDVSKAAVFMGRLGCGRQPTSRSLRKEITDLRHPA